MSILKRFPAAAPWTSSRDAASDGGFRRDDGRGRSGSLDAIEAEDPAVQAASGSVASITAIGEQPGQDFRIPLPDPRWTATGGSSDFGPVLNLARCTKMVFDIAAAICALIIFSPLMIAIAILIRADGGKAFYVHKRIGRGGRQFGCLKFRTMVVDAERRLQDLLASDAAAAREWAETRKLTRDPRVTSLGLFLRSSSLDELPQLLNVISGSMSLVGPRPIVADEAPRYGDHIAEYQAVRPGMTGLWQVSGRSDTTYARRVQLDRWYVMHWTLLLDFSILLRTIPAVFLRRGAG